MSSGSRSGVSVVEALVTLVLGLWLAQASFGVVARARTLQDELVRRSDILVSARLASSVLRDEISDGRPGVDWGTGGDSLWIRGFRGTGVVCPGATGTDSLVLAYWGHRRPDPTKDSVLLVDALGRDTVLQLTGVWSVPDLCGGWSVSDALGLVFDRPVPEQVVLARVFEFGVYAVSGAALRYRRGAGGRQPLTAEVWSTASGWRPREDGLDVEFVPLGRTGSTPWLVALSREAP